MLVIRRRAGESIVISGDVEIEVLESSPTRVKLGIRAPKEVSVVRKEVSLTADENQAASRDIPLRNLAPLVAQLHSSPYPSKPAENRLDV
jgi:carbon storage regulator